MTVPNSIESLFNVKGLVAVITGGGTGLGLYAARALDANGAKAVYIVGRREEALRAAASSGKNGTIIPLVGDVTSKDSLLEITARVRAEQGYVDFLFANAGVMSSHSDRSGMDNAVATASSDSTSSSTDTPSNAHSNMSSAPSQSQGSSKPTIQSLQSALWAPDMSDFNRVLSTNVTGAYYTVIAFLDLLDAANKRSKDNTSGTSTTNPPAAVHHRHTDASVLITSSLAGFSRHISASFAYSTSKAAVNHLVKTLSTTLAAQQTRIRVSGLAPGFYPSEMTESALGGMGKYMPSAELTEDGDEEGQILADACALPLHASPAARSGSEQDIAGLVLFLASQAGGYINGEIMVSDGGRLAQLPGTY